MLARFSVLKAKTNPTRIVQVRRLGGGHGHAPPPPTFQRLPQSKGRLHEETELVWSKWKKNDREKKKEQRITRLIPNKKRFNCLDDGVAPELAIDFDAPELSRNTGLLMWSAGLGFFVGLGLFINYIWDPASKRRTVVREIDNSQSFGEYKKPV